MQFNFFLVWHKTIGLAQKNLGPLEGQSIRYKLYLMFNYLNSVSDKAESGTNPQEHGKSRKQTFAKFHPFWGSGWGSQGIRSIGIIIGLGLSSCQTSIKISGIPLDQYVQVNFVFIEFKLLLEPCHTGLI